MQKRSLSLPIIFLSVSALLIGIFVLKQNDVSAPAPAPKSVAAPSIAIENARLRLPAPGQTTAAAFFDLVNTGGDDVLLSAKSEASVRVELHTHLHENGVMKMRRVDTVPVAADATTAFKSGGLHIMMFDLNIPEGTSAVPLTLTFERSGPKRIIAVIGGSASSGHEH